jgi:hypothetical protein
LANISWPNSRRPGTDAEIVRASIKLSRQTSLAQLGRQESRVDVFSLEFDGISPFYHFSPANMRWVIESTSS